METALKILSSYPETNPYDIDPPVFNLRPAPIPEAAFDTEEFRRALRGQTRTYGMNPLCQQYGACPLMPTGGNMFEALEVPLSNYTSPPPLLEVSVTRSLDFLEELNPSGNVPIFKVLAHHQDGTSTIRVLKLFPDRVYFPNDDEDSGSDLEDRRKRDGIPRTELTPGSNPAERFRAERDAYAHLLARGVCAAGIVPMCLGWVKLSPEDVAHISKIPNLSKNARLLATDRVLPTGILLEYLPDAVRLSTKNITMDIAETALRNLREIHAACVLHGDVTGGRNVLVLPDDRVVFIDFDRAKSGDDPELTKLELITEFAWFWGTCYCGHLTDQRIGL